MTLKDCAGVDSFNRDIETGETLSHEEVYGRLIRRLGEAEIWRFVPYDIDVLCDKFRTDRHFNNTPMRTWDFAAGFETCLDKYGAENVRWLHSGLSLWLVHHGINTFSPSQCVSLLKQCAKRAVLRANEVGAP